MLENLFKSSQRVFVAGSSNEPTALLNELRSTDLPSNLEFVQFPLAGYNATDFTQFNDTSSLTTFFMTPSLRDADPSRLNFLPMQMRAVFDYLRQDVDVALFQVAYDQEGVLRLGPNVDFFDFNVNSYKNKKNKAKYKKLKESFSYNSQENKNFLSVSQLRKVIANTIKK